MSVSLDKRSAQVYPLRGIGGINTWLALSNTSIARLEGREGRGGGQGWGAGRGIDELSVQASRHCDGWQ